jgi:hypothetical protein
MIRKRRLSDDVEVERFGGQIRGSSAWRGVLRGDSATQALGRSSDRAGWLDRKLPHRTQVLSSSGFASA